MTLNQLIEAIKDADHPNGNSLDPDKTKIKFFTSYGQKAWVLSTYWSKKSNTIYIDIGDKE